MKPKYKAKRYTDKNHSRLLISRISIRDQRKTVCLSAPGQDNKGGPQPCDGNGIASLIRLFIYT